MKTRSFSVRPGLRAGAVEIYPEDNQHHIWTLWKPRNFWRLQHFFVKGMLKNTSGLSDLYHTVFWLNRDNFITQDGPKLCSWDATRDDARILMWSTTCAKLSLRWLKMEKKAKMEPLVVSTWLKTLWFIWNLSFCLLVLGCCSKNPQTIGQMFLWVLLLQWFVI